MGIGDLIKDSSSNRIQFGDALNSLESREIQSNQIFLTAGTAAAYTLDTSAVYAPSIVAGTKVTARIHAINSGLSPTLNVNGTGPKEILGPNFGTLRSGSLPLGVYDFIYHTTAPGYWICMQPSYGWKPWTDDGGANPVITSGGSLTVGAVTFSGTPLYKWNPLTKECEFNFVCDVVISASTGAVLLMTLPVGLTLDTRLGSYAFIGASRIYTSVTDIVGTIERQATSTTQLRIMKGDSTNYGNSTHTLRLAGKFITA